MRGSEITNDQPGRAPARCPYQPGGDLRHRAAWHGLRRLLHLPHSALCAFAWDERRRVWRACWRPPSAAGVLVNPCRRLDGSVRDTAGQPVFCLVGDLARPDVSAFALVLAADAPADRQRRGVVIWLVRVADLNRPID